MSAIVKPRLDLSTPQARADATQALPGLMLASAMGSATATAFAGQIIGLTLAEALQPSIEAMHRLAAYRVTDQQNSIQEES